MNTCQATALPLYSLSHLPPLEQKDESIQQEILSKSIQRWSDNFLKNEYHEGIDFLQLPFDEKSIGKIKEVAEKMLTFQPTDVIVCGIGGSTQGLKAITGALYGTDNIQKTKIHFAETIDPLSIGSLFALLETHEQQVNFSPLLVIISKSGTTQETLINASLLITYIKKFSNPNQRICIISEETSPLSKYATENNFYHLPIPGVISGRFSTFSAVGLLPAALCGVNIMLLCLGAKHATERLLKNDSEQNPLILHAIHTYLQSKKYPVHTFFFPYPALGGLGNLIRQFYAESLGKIDKKGNCVGIYPSCAYFTTDLHSILQFFLQGSRCTLTTFIEGAPTASYAYNQPIPALLPQQMFDGLNPATIHQQFITAVYEAYTEQQIPFIKIDLGIITPRIIGALITEYMATTVMLGELYGINPFDQPAITLYKKHLHL